MTKERLSTFLDSKGDAVFYILFPVAWKLPPLIQVSPEMAGELLSFLRIWFHLLYKLDCIITCHWAILTGCNFNQEGASRARSYGGTVYLETSSSDPHASLAATVAPEYDCGEWLSIGLCILCKTIPGLFRTDCHSSAKLERRLAMFIYCTYSLYSSFHLSLNPLLIICELRQINHLSAPSGWRRRDSLWERYRLRCSLV